MKFKLYALALSVKTFLLITCIAGIAHAQDCNNALAGKNYVIDRLSSGLIGALLNGTTIGNIVDTNLNNYAELNITASLLNTSLLTIKKTSGSIAANRRIGFVIEQPGGILTADLLNGFELRTYTGNNTSPTEIKTFTGNLLKLGILGGNGAKRRIEFTTAFSCDRIELFLASTLSISLPATFRIYYAFEESTTCNTNCIKTLTSNNYSGISVEETYCGFGSTNFCPFGNIVDSDTSNVASRTFIVLGSSTATINIGTTIPGHSDIGFVVGKSGLLGLLDINLINNITIRTYTGSTPRQTFTGSSLANIGLLSNGKNIISFKADSTFNRVSINMTTIDLSLIGTYYLYYGFIREDTDNDGIFDCTDKCASGNDNILNYNTAQPLVCSPECKVYAGANITVCPSSGTTAQLPAAGAGRIWSPVPNNPGNATINGSTGAVSGLSSLGVYRFVLTETSSTCRDTLGLTYKQTETPDCNNPLVGVRGAISEVTHVYGACLLCGDPNAANVTDNDLTNYIQYSSLLSLFTYRALISVVDPVKEYPAGTRVGYVVELRDGLLSLNLLGNFRLRTYLNGTFREEASVGNGLIDAGSLPGTGNRTKIGFVTTLSYDEVELIYGNVVGVGLLSSIRIYNAFTELATCLSNLEPVDNPSLACVEMLTSNSRSAAQISYARSGTTGAACVACQQNKLNTLIDEDYQNYVEQNVTLGIGVSSAMAVKTKQTYTAGYEAGFVVQSDASLLDLGLLTNITITTYLNGVQAESKTGSGSGLLDVTLSGGTNSLGFIGFRTGQSFNEVRISYDAISGGDLLSTLRIYYAYVRLDSDGDGIPDCQEKCCGTSDMIYYNTIQDAPTTVCASLVLPVKLLSFNAQLLKDKNVMLNWETMSEIGFEKYEIERAVNNASDFSKIGHSIQPKSNNTGQQVKNNYAEYDANPEQGVNYYRLKMIDQDGRYSYSPIRSVVISKDGSTIQAFPNPVSDEVYLTGVKEGDEISISNMFGQIVKSAVGSNDVMTRIDVSDLPVSIYHVHIIRDHDLLASIKLVRNE